MGLFTPMLKNYYAKRPDINYNGTLACCFKKKPCKTHQKVITKDFCGICGALHPTVLGSITCSFCDQEHQHTWVNKEHMSPAGYCQHCGAMLAGVTICACGTPAWNSELAGAKPQPVSHYKHTKPYPDFVPQGKCINCGLSWGGHDGWNCKGGGSEFETGSKKGEGEGHVKLKALSVELDTKLLSFDLMRQLTDEFLAKNPKEAKKFWDLMAVVRGPDTGLKGTLAKIDGSTPDAEKERVTRKRQTCSILRGLFFPQAVNCSSADISTDPDAKIMLPPKDQWDHYDKHVWKVCQAHGITYQTIGQEEPVAAPAPQKGKKGPSVGASDSPFKQQYADYVQHHKMMKEAQEEQTKSKFAVLGKAFATPSLLQTQEPPASPQYPFMVEFVTGLGEHKPIEPGDKVQVLGKTYGTPFYLMAHLPTGQHLHVNPHGTPFKASAIWIVKDVNGAIMSLYPDPAPPAPPPVTEGATDDQGPAGDPF